MELTKYQFLVVKYLEAEYGYPICEILQYFRDMPLRFEDIAELAYCTPNTLRKICRAVGFNDNSVVVLDRKKVRCKGGTDFLRGFETIQDAVVHCRNKLKLTIGETQEKLGIGRTTIWRHTPEWLRYLYNSSRERSGTKRSPGYDHPWRIPTSGPKSHA